MKTRIRLALAIVSIILVVSIAANGILYNALSENNNLKRQNEEMRNQINSLQNQTQNLQSQIGELQNQSNTDNNTIAALNATITNLLKQNHTLKNENENLQAQVENLTSQLGPNLSTNLIANDVNYLVPLNTNIPTPPPIVKTPEYNHLLIRGTVDNTGWKTAYHCKLHVILYQGNTIAADTHIELGTIYGHSSVLLDGNTVLYKGIRLTNWEIFPECTNTP
jgi:hypothetical protein